MLSSLLTMRYTCDQMHAACEKCARERPRAGSDEQALLQRQSETLFNEYIEGSWAHVSACPEIGGLVCRLPLQAELVAQMRHAEGSSLWGDRLRSELLSDLPSMDAASSESEGGESEQHALFQKWASNTLYTYRLAERLIDECLGAIRDKSDDDGKVAWEAISEEEKQLVGMYSAAQVCRSMPRRLLVHI